MSHRHAITVLIERAGLSRAQAGTSAGLPASSVSSAMHDYLERTRVWPEGLLARLVEVLRPHLLTAGMTEEEIDAEVEIIRAGFAAELEERLGARRERSAAA